MTDELGRLLVAVFEEHGAAEQALEALREAEEAHAAAIKGQAIVFRNENGQLQIRERGDPGGTRGALVGGLIGAVIGLLAGPGGAIVGGAAGGLVGGLVARVVDSGIPDNGLALIGQSLLPGNAAVVVIVDEAWKDQTDSLLTEAGARVMSGSLISVLADQLRLPPDEAAEDSQEAG